MSAAVTDAVWQVLGEADRARVIAFWQRHGALPYDTDPAARARQAAAVARIDGEIAGVATAEIDIVPQLDLRFAFFREYVAPDHRQGSVALHLFRAAWQVMEAWSRAHPEEAVMGVAGIVQGDALRTAARVTVHPPSGLALAGYTPGGRQIRIRWFDHARVPLT